MAESNINDTSSRGKFITFEGIEGAGKTTHIATAQSILKKHQLACVLTCEPGATRLGKEIRRWLLSLDTDISNMAELCLLYADRAEHLDKVLIPALESGKWVISDRYADASFAYQGYGRGINLDTITTFTQKICGNIKPDLTLYFDITPEKSVKRLVRREGKDRFEAESIEFFERVRAAYLELIRQEPERWVLIDTDRPVEEVGQEIEAILTKFIGSS